MLVHDELEKVAIDRRLGCPLAALLTWLKPIAARLLRQYPSGAVRSVARVIAVHCDTLEGLSVPPRPRRDIVVVNGAGEADFDVLLASLMHDLASKWRASSSELPHVARGAEDVFGSVPQDGARCVASRATSVPLWQANFGMQFGSFNEGALRVLCQLKI